MSEITCGILIRLVLLLLAGVDETAATWIFLAEDSLSDSYLMQYKSMFLDISIILTWCGGYDYLQLY
jgi:hypothetical protein